MYKYIGCGLSNIYLENGYKFRDTSYGKAVSIADATGLHKAIGLHIIENRPKLSGTEFRFLRKEMNMSQSSFGNMFELQGQTVAIWEKAGKIPRFADLIIRTLYLENIINENPKISEFINRLNEMDKKAKRRVVFKETDRGWVPKVA